ncbi:MAG: flippase-like domain-containing protein [Acidimicrobiia bacterium]|jgi:hypothetical protein|nr:flippase-like domain-containing protein [Acidimicrobiia bacterium]
MADLDAEGTRNGRPRWSVGRVLLLVVTGFSLYLFAPSIAEVFEAWDKLGEVHPATIPVLLACEIGSFVCVWILQRIALRTHGWFVVATTQLAGNAFNRITPGGGTTGTALQATMLTDAGFDGAKAAAALTAQSLLITAAVIVMPVFALPAIFAGTSVPGSLVDALWIGLALFLGMAALGALLLATRRPVVWVGDTVQRIANLVRRHREPIRDLGARLLVERDEIRTTMGSRWIEAVAAAVGRWAFEYFVLLVTLYAIGADPNPWLTLLAFVAASVLGMVPFTPGGLGFVEAGLTATLALSGITTGEAVLATLVFRLVSFWLPMPIGLATTWMFRRRYPRAAAAPD